MNIIIKAVSYWDTDTPLENLLLWQENGNLQRETNPLWCRHTTHIHDGLLESCRVVVHVVAAEAEEACEGEHEVSVHPSEGHTGRTSPGSTPS